MPDKPALDEIRARLANHTSTLWHNHAPADIAALLEMLEREHERANALAELHRMSEAACSKANAAGMRAEARIAELETRLGYLDAKLAPRDDDNGGYPHG